MQDLSVPASGVKQNGPFRHPKLAVQYGSKEFREAKAKIPQGEIKSSAKIEKALKT